MKKARRAARLFCWILFGLMAQNLGQEQFGAV